MPSLELTPEQGQVVIDSPDPVPVVISTSEREYVIITKEALEDLRKLLSEEKLDYTFHEFSDFADER